MTMGILLTVASMPSRVGMEGAGLEEEEGAGLEEEEEALSRV